MDASIEHKDGKADPEVSRGAWPWYVTLVLLISLSLLYCHFAYPEFWALVNTNMGEFIGSIGASLVFIPISAVLGWIAWLATNNRRKSDRIAFAPFWVGSQAAVVAFLSIGIHYIESKEKEEGEAKIAADAQRITAWNQERHGEVLLTLSRSGRPKVKTWRHGGGRAFEITTSGIKFIGTLENKSAEKIVAVIIDLKVVNKEKKQVIVSHRLKVPLEVFPTATLSIDQVFAPSGYEDDYAVDEIHRAAEQLGESFAQDYEFVAAIPQSLEGIDVRKSLNVKAVLTQK